MLDNDKKSNRIFLRHSTNRSSNLKTLRKLKVMTLLIIVFPLLLISCGNTSPEFTDQYVPVKILVSESGMYKITTKELQELGWDVANINPDLLKVFHMGETVPLWIEGEGKNLDVIFHGEAATSKYTKDNVYFLVYEGTAKQGFRFGLENPASLDIVSEDDQTLSSFDSYQSLFGDVNVATIILEENNQYSPQVAAGDPFYWYSLTAPQKEEIGVKVDHLTEGESRLIIEVWGSTEAPVSPDHHLMVSVNGQKVADEWWDGFGHNTIVTTLSQGVLREGENIIGLESPGDTGVVVDIVNLDWIRLDYPRDMVAIEDRLEFVSNGHKHTLLGFSGEISVYDVTIPRAVIRINDVNADNENPSFQGEAEHKYLVLSPQGYYSPESIQTVSSTENDFMIGEGADYIAIGPPDLLKPLEPLLDFRREQGIKTIAVPVETVYDYFSYGLPEPEAIQSYLRYAFEEWENPPEYVLLVGDATYDPRGYISTPEANRVPTFMLNTLYGGETASDILFVMLDKDQLPFLPIGRLPAREPEQVRNYVDKVLAYEQITDPQEWQQKVMAVYDQQEMIFESDARSFLERFPEEYLTKIYPENLTSQFESKTLIQEIEEGNLLITYFGHGSVNVWGKNQIFSTDDVKGLSNADRLPVMMTMTCLNGLYTHPEIESLAEALLWQEDGGAIAVLAPTSLTQSLDQRFLNQAIVDTFIEDRKLALGDILLASQRQIPIDNPGAYEVMLTFLLFGDPALQISHPK